jgi:1-aminocyclopropane-1-carboxylate deaminase/D-cysteine desulfhydrase-like pyridoxal-dependent ACC family enzyme
MDRAAAQLLDLNVRLVPDEIVNTEEQVGESYGLLTPACVEAVELLASTEGIFLDPVYTAKAVAGLIEWSRTGRLGAGSTVVFLHTGGTPALFSYAGELAGSR